eukprot:2912903-Alexandrium_andersonii.AAC.1
MRARHVDATTLDERVQTSVASAEGPELGLLVQIACLPREQLVVPIQALPLGHSQALQAGPRR